MWPAHRGQQIVSSRSVVQDTHAFTRARSTCIVCDTALSPRIATATSTWVQAHGVLARAYVGRELMADQSLPTPSAVRGHFHSHTHGCSPTPFAARGCVSFAQARFVGDVADAYRGHIQRLVKEHPEEHIRKVYARVVGDARVRDTHDVRCTVLPFQHPGTWNNSVLLSVLLSALLSALVSAS